MEFLPARTISGSGAARAKRDTRIFAEVVAPAKFSHEPDPNRLSLRRRAQTNRLHISARPNAVGGCRHPASGYDPTVLFEMLTASLATFVALLPIANPFSTAAVFLALTERFSDERAQSQARRACIYTAIVLLVALFAGALIMQFFGISIQALRIAGGLIVARIGFGMLNPVAEPDLGEEEREHVSHMADLAFTPLAMPMLSGPGSIAVTIGMAASVSSVWQYLAVALGILLVAFVSWIVLRNARRLVALLGPTGMTALVRIMGFLLVCVGVQFIALGVLEAATDERVLKAIVEGLAATSH
jgi:multiple antibiotic resistance protein